MRSWKSTEAFTRSYRDPLAVHAPFRGYGDIFLIPKIQALLHSQESLEKDLEKLKLGPPLGLAIEIHDIDVVRFLLKKGADPNGWSFTYSICHLAHAVHLGDQDISELLLDVGAHPQGSGALWEAAQANNFVAAANLINHGSDVNEVFTSKIYDSLKYSDEMFRRFQLKEFVENRHERTALHAAAAEDNRHMIKFLLRKGADKNIKDKEGNRAADLLEEIIDGRPDEVDFYEGHEERLEILELLK